MGSGYVMNTDQFDLGYAQGYNAGLEQGTEDGYNLALAEMNATARKTPSTIEDLDAFWYDK